MRVMDHQYMRAPRLSTMRMMMRRIMREETRSKPINTKVTRKIAARNNTTLFSAQIFYIQTNVMTGSVEEEVGLRDAMHLKNVLKLI